MAESENSLVNIVLELSLQLKWSFQAANGDSLAAIPAGEFVISWTEESLYVLSKKAGTPAWQRPIGGIAEVAADDLITIYLKSGVVSARTTRNGKLLWTVTLRGDTRLIGRAQGAVVTFDGTGCLIALEETTGQLRWEKQMVNTTPGPTIVETSVAYVHGNTEFLSVVDIQNGHKQWETPFNPAEDRLYPNPFFLMLFTASSRKLDVIVPGSETAVSSEVRLAGYPIYSNNSVMGVCT